VGRAPFEKGARRFLGFFAHRRENFDALTEIRKMPCFSHEN
jgi:hypothetical protein